MSDMPPITQRVQMDTTNYKAGVATLNREIRVIESGFKASAAALGDWAKTSEGLEMRIDSLGQSIGKQKEKVAGLQKVYLDLANSGKASLKELQEMEIKVNKETEALGKMQSELDSAQKNLDEMGKEAGQAATQVDNLAKKEGEAEKKSISLKGALSGLGTGLKAFGVAIAGVAAGVAAVGVGIGKMFLKATDAAGELVDLSLKTGFTTTQLQEMAYVGAQVGTDLDTMTGSLSKLTRAMGDAAEGGVAADAFAKLGVSATDANGQLRDSRTVFAEALAALGGMANETERDAVALELFGRSALELNPLIKAGGDEIARLTEQAHEMGAVMAEEDVAGLEAFGDTLEGLKAGLKGTAGTLATAFLPAFKNLAGAAQGFLGQFSSIVSGSGGDLTKMASGIGGLIGNIVSDIAAKAPEMLNAGLSILKGIFGALIAQLPVIIPAVTQMLTAIVDFIIQGLPILLDAAAQILLALVNGIIEQLPMLLDAAIKIIISLANGIAAALPKLMETIARIIPELIVTLIENLPLLINAALQLILALVQGLITALPILIEYIPEIVTAIFNALITALPMIAEAAVELVVTLITGIVGMLPKIGEVAVQLIVALVDGVKKLLPAIWDVGKRIVEGIWNGIVSRAEWFGQQVWNFFKNIVDGVKKALGIESPSKVFAGIGENMALGLGKGFGASIAQVERDVNRAIDGLVGANGSLTVSGAGMATGGQTQAPANQIVNNNYYTVRNNIDIERIVNRTIERLQA